MRLSTRAILILATLWCVPPTFSQDLGSYALAFDDGPSGSTASLVQTLQVAGVKATFFLGGSRVDANPSAVKILVDAGMAIANHSYTHQHMTGWSYQQVYDDLEKAQRAIQDAGGGKPTLFRPPYLEVNATIQAAAKALGLTIVNCTVDTQDWNGATTAQIVSTANRIQDGGVFLMHEGYATTAGAIPTLVTNLRAQGLVPGAINALARAIPWPTGTGSALTLKAWKSSNRSPTLTLAADHVGGWTTDAWIRFDKVNLTGRSLLTLSLASDTGGAFKVLIDGRDGEQVGTLTYASTGGGDTYLSPSCTLSLNLNGGVHSLYLVALHGRANVATLTLE